MKKIIISCIILSSFAFCKNYRGNGSFVLEKTCNSVSSTDIIQGIKESSKWRTPSDFEVGYKLIEKGDWCQIDWRGGKKSYPDFVIFPAGD